MGKPRRIKFRLTFTKKCPFEIKESIAIDHFTKVFNFNS